MITQLVRSSRIRFRFSLLVTNLCYFVATIARMQFPVTFHIGSQPVLLHAVLETAGYFIGFRYFLYLRHRQGDTIPTSRRIPIIIATIFGALAGSRLIGGLEDIPGLMATGNKALWFYANKTVLGGMLGGLIAVELTKKALHEKHSSGDLITYPFILALIVGRIGCFSMGVYEQTYGTPTRLPWGINLGDGIVRHPVCLYEIVFLALLWLSLQSLEKRYLLADGARFKLLMIAYLFFRLLLDVIKPHVDVVVGLSTIQMAALLGLVYYRNDIISPRKLIAAKVTR